MKNKLNFLIFTLFIVMLGSCNIGLGENIDLTAPKVSITNPLSDNSYVSREFTIAGTFEEDKELTAVEIHYQYKDEHGEKQNVVRNAQIVSKDYKTGTWYCNLSFPSDQEVSITVYARDKMRNEDVNSSDHINVIIDSESPKYGTITVHKNNGFTTTTTDVSSFLGNEGKYAKRNESNYKDYFQNESIVLSCLIQENYELKDVYLNLYEISDYTSPKSYKKTLIKEKIGTDETTVNLYNPEFTITQEFLTSCNENLESDIHYLYPEIIVEDSAGNFTVQETGVEPKVFAWLAEYDEPKVNFPLYHNNNELKLAQGTSIPVILFDDDGLKSIEWTLTNKARSGLGGDALTSLSGSEDISGKMLRDYNMEIVTKSVEGGVTKELIDGVYTLLIKVTDQVDGDDSRTPVTHEEEVTVKITNADAPVINVTAPVYNTTPALTETSRFTIKGHTIDNGSVEDIAIAWCRDGDTAKAIKFFDTYKFEQKNEKRDEGNFVVWNIGSVKETGTTTKQNDFEKTFDIFTDFKTSDGKNIINEIKTFVIAARDATDNVTTEVWRVGAYNSKPSFKVKLNDVEQTQLMTSYPPKTVTVKVIPTGTLPLEYFKIWLDDEEKQTDTSGIDGKEYSVEIQNPEGGKSSVVTYTARDKLGNEHTETFTIQFNQFSELSGIICSQEGESLKTGNVEFLVNFDRAVTVTGTPYIEFDCFNGSTIKAKYVSGSNTSSLIFRYSIESGKEFKKLKIKPDGENYINLSSGKIQTLGLDAKLNLSESSEYAVTVDSKIPVLNNFTGSRTGTVSNYTRKQDGSIDIILNFSEPVTAKNGTIEIYRKGSKDVTSGEHTWHIPAVISADVFEKIWNASNSANRKVLSSSDTSLSVFGKDAYGVDSIVSAGPYKMYTNGLKLNADGSVKDGTPDMTTKYVLDWNFDTDSISTDKIPVSLAGTDTKNNVSVVDIRKALEAVDYHRTEIPLSRLTRPASENTNQYVLNLKDSDFIDGIHDGVEYIIAVPGAVFEDGLLNPTENKETDFTFTVGKVAKPVIRVNRWSTNSATQIAPTREDASGGKARVKIDCETPGANIQYQVTNITVDTNLTGTGTSVQKNTIAPYYTPGTTWATADSSEQTITNGAKVAVLTKASPSSTTSNSKRLIEAQTNYTEAFSVGKNNINCGQKIYIASKATHPVDDAVKGITYSSELKELEESAMGYEGAFKTVWKAVNIGAYYGNGYSSNTSYKENKLKVLACQTPEGVSYTAGWPLTMRQWFENVDGPSTRDCYKLAVHNGTGSDYSWVSWELISDSFFTLTTYSYNFQVDIDSLTESGSYIYVYNLSTWGGNK